jgi:hypothetical protein
MPRISVSVSVGDLLEELTTDDLVTALLERDDGRLKVAAALDLAIPEADEAATALRELIEAQRLGKDTTELLRTLADRHFGMVL